MKTYRYDLTRIAPDDRNFFTEMIPYLSEHVESIDRNADELVIAYGCLSEDALAEKVTRLEEMLAHQLRGAGAALPQTKMLSDMSDITPPNTTDVFGQLVAEGQVTRLNKGSFAYSGLFLKVKRYFELRIDALASHIFGDHTCYEMPDLIPITEYERGGYFDTFPHHIMFQTTLNNDIEIIDRFSRHKTSNSSIFDCLKTPSNVLRTAACMPLYPILEHSRIPAESPGGYVVTGHCFRNEESNVKDIERLNEFTMKELVCVGTPDQTMEFLDRSRQLWLQWQEVFGLNIRIETANDSFFASNYKKLRLFQLLGDSKVEYKLLIPGSKNYISCSSSNAHRTHFAKPYDIRTAETDAYCHTACFAFGIDRLTYALLSQLGLDADSWNETARAEIKTYVEL